MSKIYVISGGPCTGKTSVIDGLRKKGYFTLKEGAREVGDNDSRFKGKSIKEIGAEEFQDAIFKFQAEQIKKIPKREKIAFLDRALPDTITYARLRSKGFSREKIEYAKKFKYDGVFVMDFLKTYRKDELRHENKDEQKKIHEEIIKTYKEFGYDIIIVPFMSVEKRVDFILSKIK